VKHLKNGDVDNKKPKSYNLSKKLNENRRRNMHDFEEHIKNLASLQRRINSIGTVRISPISYFYRYMTGRRTHLIQYLIPAYSLGRLVSLMTLHLLVISFKKW
jgi:hypothetical protein